jgi:Cellulose binding domain
MANSLRVLRTGPCVGVVGLLVIAVGAALVGASTAGAAAGSCTATARVESQWGSGASGGQVLTVTVTNSATSNATTWSVGWTLGAGQSVVGAWNATVSVASGVVMATNAAFNGALAPGASASFGTQLAGVAPLPAMTCSNNATAGSGSTITVTEADSQTTVTMVVGQTLVVALGRDYRPLTLSGTALSLVSTTGGYPTGQPLRATYRAVAPGSVDLRTTTDYACLHTVPRCALPQLLWSLRVNVTVMS